MLWKGRGRSEFCSFLAIKPDGPSFLDRVTWCSLEVIEYALVKFLLC